MTAQLRLAASNGQTFAPLCEVCDRRIEEGPYVDNGVIAHSSCLPRVRSTSSKLPRGFGRRTR